MTVRVESLFTFVEQTIETELVEELAFLANYDDTASAGRSSTCPIATSTC